MKEIEIKATLRDKEGVMVKLAALGCTFEPAKRQEDTVYAEKAGTLKEFLDNTNFLRLRVVDGGKVLFTLKQRGMNDLDALEHEVEVSSRDEMEKMLKLMGYQEAICINKTRVITHHEGREICLDEVEGLGTFIEMETLTEVGDAEAIQEEMFQFFETLGITRAERLNTGYDVLMWQKKLGTS